LRLLATKLYKNMVVDRRGSHGKGSSHYVHVRPPRTPQGMIVIEFHLTSS